MAQTPKRLSAITSSGLISNPDLLYTCIGTASIVTTLVICNTSDTAIKYRICVSSAPVFPAGTVTGYVIYNDTVDSNQSSFLTVGFTLDSNNKYLLCSSTSTGVAISAFGVEIS